MRKASLSSCLTFLLAAHNCAQSNSLPPLLYRTRTLLSEPKIARPFPAAKSHVNSHDRRRRTFCTTPQGHASADKVRRSDPIAFVDTPYDQSSDAGSQIKPWRKSPSRLSTSRVKLQNEQHSRLSTVTASEQAAFDRLIRDVSEPTSDEPDGEDILDQDELNSGYDPNVDLDSIFEDAIKQLRVKALQAANAAAEYLISGRVSQERAIDIRLPDRKEALSARLFIRPWSGTPWVNEPQTDEERRRLEVACGDHCTKVTNMLSSAKSDKEIWQVLETEVFSLVIRLNEHIRLLERANSIRARKPQRAKAEGKDIADVELEEGKEGKEGNPDEGESPTANAFMPKAIPVDELLLILQRNYTEYCLVALRLFRKRYPTSLYAQHILSTIRQRGPISYVLGVSADIYNEALFLQWTQFSDLHGMADTIEEMLNQGIEGNEVTIVLLKGIANQRLMDRRRERGRSVVREWWYMRGTVEGWRRVVNLYDRITSQLAKRAAMLADEAKSDEGVPQTDME